LKICVINFSGRKNGNCHDIAKVIEQSFLAEHEVTLFEMCDLNITPCGKCEYECMIKDKDAPCPHMNDDIVSIYSALGSSDWIFYIVPNYSDYPNANFFIFNERKQVFCSYKPELLEQYMKARKKFVVVSNTEKENFKHAFEYHVPKNSDINILFLAASSFHKISVMGGLMESKEAKQMVVDFIKGE